LLPHFESRRRVQVRVISRRGLASYSLSPEAFEFRGRSAEPARDIEQVSGMTSAAAKRFARGRRSDQHDVGENEVAWRLRGVSAGQLHLEFLSELAESGEKSVHPLNTSGPAKIFAGFQQVRREGKGQERGYRACSHGREIAQPTRENPVPDGIRRMPVTAEVPPFQREVSRDQKLVAPRRAEDCTIVTYAECYPGEAASCYSGTDSVDEFELVHSGIVASIRRVELRCS
jgi:hypothetical protein